MASGHAKGGSAERSLAIAFAVLGAVGFAFKAVLVKLAYRYGVPAPTLLALRMLYALPFFLAMGLRAEWAASERLARRDLLDLLLLGLLGYFLSSDLDFLGLQYISAALERMILFIYPTLVVVISALLQGRGLSRPTVLALALSYAGVALAVAHDARFAGPHLWLGVGLVFLSALSYAAYLLRSGTVLKRLGAARLSAWATSVASLLALAQHLVLRPLADLAQPRAVQFLSLMMAIVSTVLPIYLITRAIRTLGPGPTAVIGSLAPVLTMLLAWAMLGEPLGLLQLAGAVLVLIGIRWITRAAA